MEVAKMIIYQMQQDCDIPWMKVFLGNSCHYIQQHKQEKMWIPEKVPGNIR